MTKNLFLLLVLLAGAAEAATDTFTVSGTWTAPAGVTSATMEAWGAGGGGGGQNLNSDGGGGGGGGAYSSAVITVAPGNTYTVNVGSGGAGGTGACGTAGGNSWFGSAVTILAAGGAAGCNSTGTPPPGGAGGTAAASIGTTKFSGGNGGRGRDQANGQGGPGGSSAGTAAPGISGADPWSTLTAAAPPAGGGIGGDGGDVGANGNPPASGYGGGGGGSGDGTNRVGGAGANGLVTITYTLPASVLSINCTAACTTNAASVSWTVTFSESVTGVNSGNFTPVNTGLGGTPAITSVTGSGTTWTVTASTGTGSGTLGLNMVNTTGVTPALTNLPFTGQVYTLDRTAPAVSSIVRADPTPTALVSVSWTVTFSESVSGVDAADFALAQAGGVSGATITAVTPVSGTVYTVTANTGTGNGILGLDLVDNDSIIDAVGNTLGGAGAGNGDFTGEAYSIAKPVTVTRSPTACISVADIGYTEAWSVLTGALVSDGAYAIASVDGTVTNFLQCTGYGFTIPSSATINGITVNVERNSNSTGNGGSKDAAMRVVKGGVIGITDRSTATIYGTGDVSEAHGGATDLWGTTWTAADINASNFGAAFAATKPLTAGPAHTISVDHISISISYTSPAAVISISCASACTTNAASVSWAVTFSESVTGLTAANFALVNTGLSGTPAITSVSGSGTIWTVTASTGIGSGTLGLDLVNTTGVAPALTNLPFTGQVYTVDRTVPAVSSIARVDPTPTALASVSWTVTFSESVTGVDITDFALVQAGGASGAAITSVAGGGTSYTVTASTGASNGTLGLNLVDDDTVIDVVSNSLGGAGAGNGNFTGEIYTLNFTAPSFVFTGNPCVHNIAFGAPGQTCTPVTWSPQIAGQDMGGVYITAVSAAGVPYRLHASQASARDMQFGLTCHNPVADAGKQAVFAGATLPFCQANGGTPAAWSAVVTVTFNAGIPSSAASYVFNYADVGSVELWMRNSATPAQVGYSGPFVVKPGGFVLSGIQQTAAPNLANPAAADATGAKFVKAGEAFSVTVTATAIDGVTAVPNYGKEIIAEGVKLTSALVAPVGGNHPVPGNGVIMGVEFGAGGLVNDANGVATVNNLSWSEVGIITLTPSVADADYLGAGDVSGTASGNIGRFHAAQFSLSGGIIANRTGLCPAPAGCGTFTYMGEQMSAVFSLTAKAADGVTTLQNYAVANNFAKFDPAAAGNPLALAAVDTGVPRTVVALDTTTYGAASGSFGNVTPGVASVTAPFAVTRGAAPSGPFDALAVGIAPVDGDGAALAPLDLAVNAGGAPNTHGMVGSTKARYGRLRLSNAHGSELLVLPVTVTAQFWDGATYATNALDNNSTFAAAGVLFSNYQKNLAAGETSVITPPASVTFVNGIGSFRLAKPGTGNNGSVDMTVDIIAAYLPSNTARATFGVYKGSNEFIYLREVY